MQNPMQNIDQPKEFYLVNKSYCNSSQPEKIPNPFNEKEKLSGLSISYPKDFIPIEKSKFKKNPNISNTEEY